MSISATDKYRLTKPRFVMGQELGKRHVHKSACTGKSCSVSDYCARKRKAGNTLYTGPLLHMSSVYGGDCHKHGIFVDVANVRRQA